MKVIMPLRTTSWVQRKDSTMTKKKEAGATPRHPTGSGRTTIPLCRTGTGTEIQRRRTKPQLNQEGSARQRSQLGGPPKANSNFA